ncbi:MAG: two-component regulator propeller domain-containing protein [Saprospiraceae bacterium]
MKSKTTRMGDLLFFTCLFVFVSCTGQNSNLTTQKQAELQTGKLLAKMDPAILIIFQDSKNNHWFAGGDGLYKYDGKNLRLYTKQDGLCSNRVRRMQEDQQGNLYFDSGEGISQYDGKTFRILDVEPTGNSADAWKLEPNDLWFEGKWNENGPFRFDGNKLYHLNFPKHPQEEIYYANNPNTSITPYDVYSTHRAADGSIWFGTSNLGVCRYDGTTFSWISADDLCTLDDGPAPGVRSITADGNGNFWFSNAPFRYAQNALLDMGTIELQKQVDLNEFPGAPEEPLRFFMSMTLDTSGALWAATYDQGVYKFDGKQISHFPVMLNNEPITIFSTYTDKQGTVWLGTHKGGAFTFNGNSFVPFQP